MDIIGQQVSLGSHQQCVPSGVWSQRSCRQTCHSLVDVEQGDVRVLGALAQSVGHRSLTTSMRVVDKNLLKRKRGELRAQGENIESMRFIVSIKSKKGIL